MAYSAVTKEKKCDQNKFAEKPYTTQLSVARIYIYSSKVVKTTCYLVLVCDSKNDIERGAEKRAKSFTPFFIILSG